MPMTNCKQCQQSFFAKPSWIKNGYGIYCSKLCHNQSARTGKEVPCFTCQTLVYKSGKALKGSKSGKYFCTKTCQTKWRNTIHSGPQHSNWKDGKHAYRRMMHPSTRPQVCGRCKTADIRVLAVHHLDHDRTNNTLDNLVWLCHNCHHLTHHYPDGV